jgi:hypothetical protein
MHRQTAEIGGITVMLRLTGAELTVPVDPPVPGLKQVHLTGAASEESGHSH